MPAGPFFGGLPGPKGLMRPLAGRAGTQQGGTLLHPKPAGFCPQPSGGYPPPGPGVLFPRRKSTQKGAGETPDPLLLSNRTLSNLDGTLPLNQRILRGSDLWRVSYPASPDGLLKGQMNLFVLHDKKDLSSRGPYPSGHRPGEVRQPPHRLRGASGKKEFQW